MSELGMWILGGVGALGMLFLSFWLNAVYKRLDSIDSNIRKFLEFNGEVRATLRDHDRRLAFLEALDKAD